MALSRNHSTTADATFSATGKTNWEAGHALSGAVSGGIPYFDSTTTEATSALLAANGVIFGGGAGAAPFTVSGIVYTSGNPGLTLTGLYYDTTVGYYLANGVNGFCGSGGPKMINSASVQFGSTTNANSGATDASIGRGGANQLIFAGAFAQPQVGAATTRAEINKPVTAIADNVATAALTFTVPNAAHSAAFRVRLKGSLGAGGAIGANESTQDAEYNVNITRTAGVNAVATIGAVIGQAAAASVAGANNAAVTGTLSAISGAVGATNTFTVNVTIARSGGSSTNHTCFAYAELLNDNASGVTVA